MLLPNLYMKNKVLLWLVIATLLLVGCRTTKHLETGASSIVKDSVRTEVRTRTIYVTDTVLIEIPSQKAERTTKDSISHLENEYATSDARINADGTLFHVLSTRPQKKSVEIQKPIEQRDSISYKYINHDKTKTITKKERLPLTWWEKTRIYGFYLLLVWLGIIYRKPIWGFIKTNLKW